MLSFTEKFTVFSSKGTKNWMHAGIRDCSTLEDDL